MGGLQSKPAAGPVPTPLYTAFFMFLSAQVYSMIRHKRLMLPMSKPSAAPTQSRSSPKVADIDEPYLREALTVFVVGASGDLAKKKTYPSLFDLFRHGFFPEKTVICGYARSAKSDADFRAHIRPWLKKGSDEEKDAFLNMCIYRNGGYDSSADVGRVFSELGEMEKASGKEKANRLFYFAIPPSVFEPIGKSIKAAALDGFNGWYRLIIEKPFGKDTASFEKLHAAMGGLYTEDHIYRIDHYLGKEMVNNLMLLRFSNTIYEPIWNRDYIASVTMTFKEDFGTKGRGGYFDGYGIIRDVIQNHLLQVMTIVAMEPPVAASGEGYANYVRNEKVKVLNCIEPVTMENCVLGQYLAPEDGSEPAYVDDPTVPSDSVTPTFATIVLYVNNKRWQGVPFIFKAGKAVNERKGEIRVQFKPPAAAPAMFPGEKIPPNELVMRLQPDEAIYMKANIKEPGLKTTPVVSELDLSYKSRFKDAIMFDAYTRLILDVLRGSQAAFVRDDELRAAWKIFTPILHEIDSAKTKPVKYKYGSRGPKESDELIAKVGFQYYGEDYDWKPADQ